VAEGFREEAVEEVVLDRVVVTLIAILKTQ